MVSARDITAALRDLGFLPPAATKHLDNKHVQELAWRDPDSLPWPEIRAILDAAAPIVGNFREKEIAAQPRDCHDLKWRRARHRAVTAAIVAACTPQLGREWVERAIDQTRHEASESPEAERPEVCFVYFAAYLAEGLELAGICNRGDGRETFSTFEDQLTRHVYRFDLCESFDHLPTSDLKPWKPPEPREPLSPAEKQEYHELTAAFRASVEQIEASIAGMEGYDEIKATSAIETFLLVATRDREILCNALRPNCPYSEAVFLTIRRLDELHKAALQEAKNQGLLPHLAPKIDELVCAHNALVDDAHAVFELYRDVDAGLVQPSKRPRNISATVYERHKAAVRSLEQYIGLSESQTAPPNGRQEETWFKWMYDLAMNNVSYGTIRRRLEKKPKTWPRYDSDNGVKYAIRRYADRNKLPVPAPRKAGSKKHE